MKKKLLSLSFLILFLAVSGIASGQSVDLSSDPAASIHFTSPAEVAGTSFVNESNVAAEAYSEQATIDGVPCRKIPAGKFLYVRVDRSIVPTMQREVVVAITFYDNSGNNLWFNYNSTNGDYKIADFAKSKSNKWVTTFVNMTDAAFSGRMNSGGDFRMGFNNEANYIRDIKVYLGSFDPLSQAVPERPVNPANEFKGKSFAGYQIWHRAGKSASDWVHWAYGKVPGPGLGVNINIVSFPDLSEYPDSVLYTTKFASLGDGRPTKLYNSSDSTIINRQMGWLKNCDFDGVAIQRFVGSIGRSVTITEESHLTNVKNAAERTGRLFYVCYDLNGSDATIVQRMQMDWVYEIEQIRSLPGSPNYATVNGKPVVEIWGIGYDVGANKQQCLDMIQFLHDRGCYVIGGVPRGWRTDGGFNADYVDVYKALDAISPWTVGVYNTMDGATNYYNGTMKGDKAYCDQNGMDYLPVVFAGSGNWLSADGSFSETDRKGGGLLWRQITNAKNLGLNSVYYAMLDEFEEGTNLIKGAVDYFDIPTNEYFETWAKDGYWVSSDYYLRLASTAAKVLRGELPLTAEIPVPYSLGPLYYRNSFESRTTKFTQNGTSATRTMKIDPCFLNPQIKELSGVSGSVVKIVNETDRSKTGLYSAKISGTPVSADKSIFNYKISDTKIEITENLQLSFWKYTEDELGKYTTIDLLLKSGKKLSGLPDYTDNNGIQMTAANPRGTIGNWEEYTCQIGKGELVGDIITGICISYNHPSSGNGSFNAYFDDVMIQYGEGNGSPSSVNITYQNATRVLTSRGQINILNLERDSYIAVYSLTGQLLYQKSHAAGQQVIAIQSGFYIVRISGSGSVQSQKVIVPLD